MKSSVLYCVVVLLTVQAIAQKNPKKSGETIAASKEIRIPMEPAYWEYDSTAVVFSMHRNVQAAQPKDPKRGYQIFLKNQSFTDGTIEYDVELTGMGFPGINFRMSDDRKNGDNFYIRSFGPVTPETRVTLQYAAIIDGVSMWDLSDEYQAGAVIYQEGWNHVKLIASGKQLKAYVNDMKKPALIVPEMESRRNNGTISFSGNVIYANLVIRPNATEGLSPEAGYISTCNDSRYLRKWMVTKSIEFPFGKDVVMPLLSMFGTLNHSDVPDSTMEWTPIVAESRGIVNLSRIYGGVQNDVRRLAWLKTTIQSDKAQEKVLNFGFSDEVWVFINGQLLYIDKNYFGTPSQKEFRGRCTIENTTIRLPLKEGKNEILIALGNYFYGWGIIARLNDTEGIHIER